MPEIILPSPMVGLLEAFEPCFRAPSYRIFRLVLVGWLHCLGRRTITAVALASGEVEPRRRGAGGVPAGADLGPDRAAGVHPDRRHAGTEDGQGDRAGDDAPRPLAVDRAQAVLQLRPCLGRAGALGAVADGWCTGLRAAIAVPVVRRGQAGRHAGCAGPTTSRHSTAGGGSSPRRSPAADQTGACS
jgi:hypothetical protein